VSNWVLLRGLMREARHWGGFPAALGTEFPDAAVTALDLPGNGRLHLMPSPLRVEDMAEFCRQELLARGIWPPYHLLALSLGAMVAVAWAERHPDELGGCVLINTSLRPFSPFHQRLKPRNYASLLAALMGGVALEQERLILRLTSCHGDAQADVLDAWNAYRRECPVARRNALRQLIAAIRYRAPARKPAVPMLILASEDDRLVDVRCSKRLASQWQTGLMLHPEAGHDLPLDDGPWVARQIARWLQHGNHP
jgi:pimeloyl-ACP methyl ester carboxylesterase